MGERFVGRKGELAAFQRLLAAGEGGVVLICGPSRFGKSWLANRMLEQAGSPDLPYDVGVLRYEIHSQETADVVMERILGDAAEGWSGSFSQNEVRLGQWKTLLSSLPIAGDLGALFEALQSQVERPAYERLGRLLRELSDQRERRPVA